MTHRFDKFFQDLIEVEGGYANHPNDKGGETKFGISKRQFPDLNIKDLTLEKAKELYRENYWRQEYDTILHEGLAYKAFEAGVHMRFTRAHALLQTALRSVGRSTPVDGILGPKTVEEINNANGETLLAAYRSELAGHYRCIVKSDPSQGVFLDGWLNRAYS